MFYQSKLKAMPPKLLSDDKKNIVIRPLAYCREDDLVALAELKEFPIIPCNLCGSQDGLQRNVVKEMLVNWERQYPGRIESIFSSIKSISPSQLADTELFDFETLQIVRDEVDHSTEIKAINL
jgi:tRNA 2-thiocytidine biosynthesis protein TtcA